MTTTTPFPTTCFLTNNRSIPQKCYYCCKCWVCEKCSIRCKSCWRAKVALLVDVICSENVILAPGRFITTFTSIFHISTVEIHI
jgi:hypothetical protein